MSEDLVIPVSEAVAKSAWCDNDTYLRMYEQSIKDPEGFWGEHGKRIDWIKPFTKVKDTSFDPPDVHIRWYHDGTLNASANCLDRHLARRGDQTALIFEGDDPSVSQHITYRELHEQVCKFANVLKGQGVKKGDRVTLYLPMIPALPITMLACARIGAIHSIVFGGFSPDALAGRIQDCELDPGDHLRRGAARRAQSAAQGQRRSGAEVVPDGEDLRCRQAHRRQHPVERRARRLVRRAHG